MLRNYTYEENEEVSIYNEDDVEVLLEEDMIGDFEEGFMRGYISS